MSVTPDALEAPRRASTWLAQYMWRRGLFEVQYAGMSTVERVEALAGRSAGYEGGMPPGAKLGSEEAFERWMQGERAYVPELRREPLFVRLDGLGRFTTVEMHTDDVGAVFADLGEELGLEPHASGLNSLGAAQRRGRHIEGARPARPVADAGEEAHAAQGQKRHLDYRGVLR